MRVILSEGSGLTSRQVAWRLGKLGHEVELLSSSNLCLSRFTRHVRAVHSVPPFGSDPFGWLDAARQIARDRAADLLFPTQEQVTLLSAQEKRLSVPTIVPPFAALRRVQDKVSACRTLAEIGVPQPRTVVLGTPADLRALARFPVFVKRPISTASSGVRQARSADELLAAASELGMGPDELIAQEQVIGPLAMIQAVAKTRLVSALRWHGGLSLDVILTTSGPVIIDVNPRLVEPGNAFFSGVDLVSAMLDLVTTGDVPVRPRGRAGVVSHQSLLSILGVAEKPGSRRAIVREAIDAMFLRGPYAGSREELTPIAGDPLAAIPVLAAFLATMLHPPLWQTFHGRAVSTYAVTPKAWRDIIRSADG
jgi:hypothetical protein